MIKNIYKYIALVFVLSGCCGNNAVVNPTQETKLKRVVVYPNYRSDTVVADTFRYDFYYNASSEKLTEVRLNDSSYLKISDYNQNTIEIDETLRFSNGDIVINKLYAHIDDLNRILSVNPTPNEIIPVSGVYNADKTDTIYQPDFLPIWNGIGFYYLMSQINTFNFTYQNYNCIQSKMAYENRQNFASVGMTKDTNSINMTYNTSLLNVANLIPMQTGFNDLFAGAYNWIDYTFVLGVNRCYYQTPNRNLLQTSDFYTGYNNNIRYYEYKTDNNGNVLEMCVKQMSTTSNCTKFRFEYY